MARKDTPDREKPALFNWECATAPTRTINDHPTLFGLEEIPIRPTTSEDEEVPAHNSGSTK